MKKLLKTILIIAVVYAALVFFAPKHISNGLKYLFSNVDDYKVFTNNTLLKSTEPHAWQIGTRYNLPPLSDEAEQYMADRKTCAFLVIQNGEIIHEKYYDEYDSATISGSFSVAKTINALLIGKLIETGKIGSLDDDVKKYVPELTQIAKGQLTIRDLMTMSGSLDWKESYWNIFSLTAESYYGDDLDHVMSELKLRTDEKPGTLWEYQSCCTQILGYIIKHTAGKTVSEYAQETLWQPLGMESDALWSTDHNGGTEKTFCCLNTTARDFAKLGYFILNKGKVDTTQIINESWINEMVTPATHLKTADGRTCDWYGYQTWIIHYDNLTVPYLRGVHGQLIYVVPEKNAVIVRLGKKIEKKHIDAHEQNDDIKAYLKYGLSLLK
jgi:CubicO group peptidase (beta-lactamase class C family)